MEAAVNVAFIPLPLLAQQTIQGIQGFKYIIQSKNMKISQTF